VPLTNSNGESWTQGLTGLIDRSSEYYKQVPSYRFHFTENCCCCSSAASAFTVQLTCAVLPMCCCMRSIVLPCKQESRRCWTARCNRVWLMVV
jgi:hypothetical protein